MGFITLFLPARNKLILIKIEEFLEHKQVLSVAWCKDKRETNSERQIKFYDLLLNKRILNF